MGAGSLEQESREQGARSGEQGARSKANFEFRIADFEFGRICPIAKVLRAS